MAKVRILIKANVQGKTYEVGTETVFNKETADILIRKGKAIEVQETKKTAKSDKEE